MLQHYLDANSHHEAYLEGWRSRDALDQERIEQAWRMIHHLRQRDATAREALRQSREYVEWLRRQHEKSYAARSAVLAIALALAMIGWTAWWVSQPVAPERLAPASGLRMAVQR